MDNPNIELSKIPIYTPYQTTYHRTKTDGGIKESEAVLKRYYSSIDAEIYFDNEFVEEISDINWTIQQNVRPIFGYNSYTADVIAQGSRIIQGMFAIRFITPNYLFKILEAAKGDTLVGHYDYRTHEKERQYLAPKGNIDHTFDGTIAGTNSAPLWEQTFDIDIIYGKKTKMSDEVHVILEDVKIVSCSSNTTASSPLPMTETYSFYARDYKTFV